MTDLGPRNAPVAIIVGGSQARAVLVVASPRHWMVASELPSVHQPHQSDNSKKNVSLVTIVLGLSPERIKQLREVRKDCGAKTSDEIKDRTIPYLVVINSNP